MAGYRRRKYKRKRPGYVRPSRAIAKQGWSLRELARLSGTTPRSIRSYLAKGVLPRSPFLGTATRYDRRQLLWLLALRRLRVAEQLSLAASASRLQALSPAELETFATQGLAAGPLAEALGLRVASSPAPPSPAGSSATQLPRWARVELALGLELHVRDDASPRTLELARRVHALCAELAH